jgi:hypothetical protein
MKASRSSSSMHIRPLNSSKHQHPVSIRLTQHRHSPSQRRTGGERSSFQIFVAILFIALISISPLPGAAQSGNSGTYDSLSNAMSQVKEDFSKADAQEKLSMSLEVAASSLALTPVLLHIDGAICAGWYITINRIIEKYAPLTSTDPNAVTIVKKAQDLRDKLGLVCDPHTAAEPPKGPDDTPRTQQPPPKKPTPTPQATGPTPEEKQRKEVDDYCALRCQIPYQNWRAAAESLNELTRQYSLLMMQAAVNHQKYEMSASDKADYQKAAEREKAAKDAYEDCIHKCYQQAVGAKLIPAVPAEFNHVTPSSNPIPNPTMGMTPAPSSQTSPSSAAPTMPAPPGKVPTVGAGALHSDQPGSANTIGAIQAPYPTTNPSVTTPPPSLSAVGTLAHVANTVSTAQIPGQAPASTQANVPVQKSETTVGTAVVRTQGTNPSATQPVLSAKSETLPAASGASVTSTTHPAQMMPPYQLSTTVRVNNAIKVGQNVRPGDYVMMDGIVHETLGAQWKAVSRVQGGAVIYQSPAGQQRTASFENGQIVIR